MKASIAHLIPAPFTQQSAQALDEAGWLDSFYCTLVDQPDRSWQQFAKHLSKLVRFDLETNLKRRRVTAVDAAKVKSYPFRESSRMLLAKLFPDKVLEDKVFHWARDGFDSWVAGQATGMDVLYGYEYGSLEMFRAVKAAGGGTVYDLPSPEHDFVERLLAPEFEKFPELQTSYRGRVEELHAERTERRRQEWELADLIVANSNFTANSWTAAGWSEKPVAVVPYGAPPVVESFTTPDTSGPLRMLWAGTFSVRKGAHYLIEAVESLSEVEKKALVIEVYGAITLPDSLMQRLPEPIQIMGSVPRPKLFEAMQRCELLVFPTLCDGFGLVVNEAFAQGMPVLTTRRAGAADLVEEGSNGYLIEAGSAEAIVSGLRRAMDERSQLLGMREVARQTAAKWQWSDYRKGIADAIRQAFPEKLG